MILPCCVACALLGKDEAALAAAAIATLLLIHERRVICAICDTLLSFDRQSTVLIGTPRRSRLSEAIFRHLLKPFCHDVDAQSIADLTCPWRIANFRSNPPEWRKSLLPVKPDTVIGWHRKGLRLYWKWKSRCGPVGRPGDANGNPRADPQHELFEHTPGSAEAARRTAQAWDRGGPGDRREAHGEAPQAAFADVADVSGESLEGSGLGGLHHRYERRIA